MVADPWPGRSFRPAQRRRRLKRMLDFRVGHGLEIGPLDRPMVRSGAGDVSYLDVFDRDALRRHYSADMHRVDVDAIPEIDYVLIQPDGRTRSLAEAARSGAPFDWIVASHVIEHVPDLIGWLADLADLAVDGGALGLVVPDQRYTFDVHRTLTTVGQLVQAHEDHDVRPSVRAVYDHFSAATIYDTRAIWRGESPAFGSPSHGSDRANEEVSRSQGGEYVDCHVWLFTPESFLQQMRELRRSGRSSWYVDQLDPTKPNGIEFFVTMRRLPREADARVDPEGELGPTLDKPEPLLLQDVQQRLEHAQAIIARLEKRARQHRHQLRAQRSRLEQLDAEPPRRRNPVARLIGRVTRRR